MRSFWLTTTDHTIGSPLALSSPDYATKAWRKFDDIAALQHPNVKITQGSLTSIDPDRRVAKINLSSSGETQEDRYDFFIAATGLQRVWPVVPQSLTKEKYLAETADHIECVTTASHGTVVVGGGAVGIEMAAEAKLCHPHTSVKLVHSRSKLLSSEPLPDEVKDLALHALRDAGVEVFLSERVTGTTASIGPDGRPMQTLTLQDGSHLVASQVITAISRSVPATSYLPESALDSEGLVKIDSQ
jgi:NADPH-dependent 2,4-dienoyl-CoA reductase/sulfur reductase-like enzyme